MRTWSLEMALVAVVMAAVAWMSGTGSAWVGSLAVVLSFGHAQVADRMREKEQARPVPDVHCWRWSDRYFIGKEVTWAAYFMATKSWPALAGVAVFLAYPFWRRFHRLARSRSTPKVREDMGED